MSYTEINENQLESLGSVFHLLVLAEGGYSEDHSLKDFFLYGIVKKGSSLFDSAKDAVEEYEITGDDKEALDVDGVAIAIPISDDTIYYLIGSGYLTRDEEIAWSLKGSKGVIKTCSLRFSSQGGNKVKFSELGMPMLAKGEDGINEYYQEFILKSDNKVKTPNKETKEKSMENEQETKESSKKADSLSSRIVRILDENHNTWDESDKDSTMALLLKVKEAPATNNFVSYSSGNASEFLIEVKNGPVSAFRYISNKLDQDIDDIKKEAAVLSKEELELFLEDILSSI